jgi:hypothetical protein
MTNSVKWQNCRNAQNEKEGGHNMENRLTIDDIKRDYPNYVTTDALAKYFGKKPQNIRNMAQKGLFPFAVVEKRRSKSTYLFPTERFLAWLDGKI